MRYEKYNNHSVEAIIELDKEAVEDFYELIKDVYSRNDFYDIENYYANGEFYVLLDDNGQVIGTCAYVAKDPTTAELKRLRVKKDLRGKGLGKSFLVFMENKIKEAGYKTLILNTSIMRESTLKFYEKMGFEVTGKKPYGGIELVYFKKELSPAGKQEEIISCCGTICSACKSFPNECVGCPSVLGKPYWTKYVGIETCPLYACCVNEKEYAHCGLCNELPCSKYSDLVDPSMTDEEHEKSITDRVNVLKNHF